MSIISDATVNCFGGFLQGDGRVVFLIKDQPNYDLETTARQMSHCVPTS